MPQATRVEHDLLGDRAVPADAYYGIHTLRALENFPITGVAISIYPELVRALACVKQAAALTNHALGLLGEDKASAIVRACEDIRGGQLHDQFVVDVIQGGAGTSTNMNANEVIANRALEHLGKAKGDYQLPASAGRRQHEPEHQRRLSDRRQPGAELRHRSAARQHALPARSVRGEGRGVRRRAQDRAHPAAGRGADDARAGVQRLRRHAGARTRRGCEEAALLTREINLGATAIGTGINAHPDYAALVCRKLGDITGIAFITAPNLVEATQDVGAFVQLSGVLKRIAVKLSKSCNDLRLLSSGPRAGFNEINLPAVQAGSSIMPGKVNPVIPEVVNQVAYEVIGNDVTVSLAAEAGQLQLNAFEPIIAHSLFKSIDHLASACRTLADRCVERHHRQPRSPDANGRELDRHRHRAQPVPRLCARQRDRA